MKRVEQVYVVRDTFNLFGDTLKLPQNSTLRFSDTGYLVNGVVLGNKSRIDANDCEIFTDIDIKGSWAQTKVFGSWFRHSKSADSNDYFSNLMTLCKGEKLTHLYTPNETIHVKAINGDGSIKVPSNVYWHNSSTVMLLPCSYEKYSIVLLHNVSNVTIDGGFFIGDVANHSGNKGEWGHGIKCGGAKKITLKNLSCNYCWGDGIDLIEGQYINGKAFINCNTITIDDVKCLNNRRQGLSIEAAENVVVKNSRFCNNGFPKYTAPGSGIDIEPWNGDEVKIKGIRIENCVIENNKWVDLQCMTNWKFKGPSNSLVAVNKCKIGILYIDSSEGITFKNTSFSGVSTISDASNITFMKCRLNKIIEKGAVSDLKIESCDYYEHSSFFPVGLILITSLMAFSIYNKK